MEIIGQLCTWMIKIKNNHNQPLYSQIIFLLVTHKQIKYFLELYLILFLLFIYVNLLLFIQPRRYSDLVFN